MFASDFTGLKIHILFCCLNPSDFVARFDATPKQEIYLIIYEPQSCFCGSLHSRGNGKRIAAVRVYKVKDSGPFPNTNGAMCVHAGTPTRGFSLSARVALTFDANCV